MRDASQRPFCLSLYDGVVAHLAEKIDEAPRGCGGELAAAAHATVDRNVLRLGPTNCCSLPRRRPPLPWTRPSSWRDATLGRFFPLLFNGGLANKIRQALASPA